MAAGKLFGVVGTRKKSSRGETAWREPFLEQIPTVTNEKGAHLL